MTPAEYAQAWRAGRDAAANVVKAAGLGEPLGEALACAIRALEPPMPAEVATYAPPLTPEQVAEARRIGRAIADADPVLQEARALSAKVADALERSKPLVREALKIGRSIAGADPSLAGVRIGSAEPTARDRCETCGGSGQGRLDSDCWACGGSGRAK